MGRRAVKRRALMRRTPLRARSSRPRLRADVPQSPQPPKRGPRARAHRLKTRISQPNARELRWREAVRDLGSIIDLTPNVEIHHCAGRTARHDGVAIGHYWILPLTRAQHQGPAGIHAHPDRKAREKELFEHVLVTVGALNTARDAGIELPPPHVIAAIRSFRR